MTGAVTAELLRTCDQVVLNVRSDNPPALQAYRRLGYADHVRFEERLAHRLGSPWPGFAGPLRRLFSRKETIPTTDTATPPSRHLEACRPTTSPTSAWPPRASAGSNGRSGRCRSCA